MSRSTYRFLSLLAVPAAVVAVAAPGAAHHSTAMFEWGKEVTIPAATVERWDWTNPHTFLYVQVPNASGGSDRWAFEGMSPNHLGRHGWGRRTMKPGDKISLTYYPLRDGRKGGFNVAVTLPDGKKLRQLDSPTQSPASQP